MRHRGLAFVALLILALAACNGGSGGPAVIAVPGTPVPTPGSATVSFLVIVPPAGASRTRPGVVVPSNATSVTFTLDSVNGTSYSGTPTTEKLSATNSACQSVSGQLSCSFNLAAPVGTLIYTVTVYSGSSVLAEGNVSFTTTNGATVSAPLTLTGTVAKIVLSVGSGVVGVSSTSPVTVQAEDSNGNTILGTYTSPITLTDTDASGQTSITTSGSDNPTSGQLISSSDVASLAYKGGAMSSAATIAASASGVSTSNVTNGSFLPAANYLAQSGTPTFGVAYAASWSATNMTPSPGPTESPGTIDSTLPITVATGQTFGTTTNLVSVTGGVGPPNGIAYLSTAASVYYNWSSQGGAAVLGFVGWSDPNNTYYPYNAPEYSLTATCAAPYAAVLEVPMPATWSPSAGSGPCTTAFNDDLGGDSDAYVYNANGSYQDTFTGVGDYEPPGTAALTVDPSGNVTYSFATCCGNGTMTVAAPSPNASTVPVSFANPSGYATFFTTPAPSTALNPWRAIGLTNGVPPNPLYSDTFTNVGAISSLPAACAVAAGLVPASNPPLSEADETVVAADPMSDWQPFYVHETIKHYYLNGVGEICNENQTLYDYFESYNDISPTTHNWFSFSLGVGSAINWYTGYDTNWDSDYYDTYTFITQTTLTAVAARVRNFTSVMPTATQALTAASYALARARITRAPHFVRSTMKHAWKTP
jgi:hypothetical protein